MQLHACVQRSRHANAYDASSRITCFTPSAVHPALQGDGVSLVQELPIGKPCASSEIDSLVAAKDVASLCPWYLDLASGAGAAGLARVVDRMKALSSSMQVALCKVRWGWKHMWK
jgi:hypothetical protein